MITCESCFNSTTWIAAVADRATPGTCSFGHGYSSRTWESTAWTDYLYPLVDLYSPALPPALALAERLQEDWQFLTLEPAQAAAFLASAIPDAELSALVRLDIDPETDGTDHMVSWAQFVEEITHHNRYFPQTPIDRAALLAAVSSSETTIRADTALYRVRRCKAGAALDIAEMGAPPATEARAGRANPAGIAYLYAAMDDDTAVHEARISNQDRCCIATFLATRDLQVLDLADIEPPDPFAGDDLKRRLSSAAYLRELARELSIPTRESDREITYVPTQYLCELVKSAGYDGVLYGSSLKAEGKNIVLFDEQVVVGESEVRVAKVTGLAATWAYE